MSETKAGVRENEVSADKSGNEMVQFHMSTLATLSLMKCREIRHKIEVSQDRELVKGKEKEKPGEWSKGKFLQACLTKVTGGRSILPGRCRR